MDNQKKVLTEIAKSYNDDLAREQIYRNNRTQCLVGCGIWVISSIVSVWWPKLLESFTSSPMFITWYGVMLLAIIGLNIYSVHLHYKAKAKHLLEQRTLALQIRDQ
jgi:hypothetical protein